MENLAVSNVKEKEKYEFHSIVFVSRRLDPPALMGGKKVTQYDAPMRLFVNTVTGELVLESELPHDAGIGRGFYYGERCLQREYVLKSLRPEVREFATFVLQFRNYRRGIVVGINQVVRWYARIKGVRASNVRRYVPVLREARIVDGDTLLGPLFQYAGTGKKASEHLGEELYAANKVDDWLRRQSQRAGWDELIRGHSQEAAEPLAA